MVRLGLGTTGRLILDGLEVCGNGPDQIQVTGSTMVTTMSAVTASTTTSVTSPVK